MRKSMLPGGRARFAVPLVALALMVDAPGAAAATSGGWSNLGHGATASLPPIDGKVETFTSANGKLYVGGDFLNAGGLSAADLIATWNGSSWAALGGGLGNNGAVYAIAVDPGSGKVFAGGSFENAGGDNQADGIAVFDGGSWKSLTGVGLNGNANAMVIIGGTLIVGGAFGNVNDIAEADGVAAYSIAGGTWSALTDDSGDIGGTVSSLVPDGAGGLYMGGSFLNADGIAAADYVAHWTGGTSWSSVGGSSAINDRVRALAINGPDLYVGGDFSNAGGDPDADRVAHWNGSSWSALGSSVFGTAGMSVYALAADGDTVVAAGYFNNAGGQARMDGVAAFVDGAWTNVGTNAGGGDGPASLNTIMFCLRVIGAELYLGGLDPSIGDSTMNAYIASFKLRQPDALIATTAGFAGNNVYNTTGAQQAKTRTVQRTKTGTFSIKVGNDGLGKADITVKGAASSGAFKVTYLSGVTDVTAQVVAGTYTITNLAAGGSRTLTLKVRVSSGAAVGSSKSFLVRVTTIGGGSPKDAVKAIVKVS